MGEVVHLNKYRKARRRATERRLAAENRTRLGQAKTDADRLRAESERARKLLDDKRLH